MMKCVRCTTSEKKTELIEMRSFVDLSASTNRTREYEKRNNVFALSCQYLFFCARYTLQCSTEKPNIEMYTAHTPKVSEPDLYRENEKKYQ